MEELIIKIQNGDIHSFEILFDSYKNTALRTAYLITGNIHTSEDIVQETFVQCYNNINKLKNPMLFKPWFFKILTRTSWKYSNKDKKVVPVEELYENQNQEEKIDSEEIDFLYEEIEKLEPKLKTTIVLHYFNDLSIKEIAATMNCFEGTVKSRLFNARKRLKNSILKREAESHEKY